MEEDEKSTMDLILEQREQIREMQETIRQLQENNRALLSLLENS